MVESGDMATVRIEEGRWTKRIRHSKNGVWWGLIFDEWITHPAYTEARLVLEGGPTVLISAVDLQRVFASRPPRGRPVEVAVDPKKSTLNGQVVDLRREV